MSSEGLRTGFKRISILIVIGALVLAPSTTVLAPSSQGLTTVGDTSATQTTPVQAGTSEADSNRNDLSEDLLALAGVDGELGVDPATVDALASREESWTVKSPSSVVDWGRDTAESAAKADGAAEMFRTVSEAGGVSFQQSPEAQVPSEDLSTLILQTYDLAGVDADIQTRLNLLQRTAQLDGRTSTGLAIVVNAVNEALILQQSGVPHAEDRGAALILDATQEAKPYLDQGGVSTASQAANGHTFEDPLGLIVVGNASDSTYGATPHRMVQIDPGGDDEYRNRAGTAIAEGVTGVPALDTLEVRNEKGLFPTLGEVFNNVTLGPVTGVTNISRVLSGNWSDAMVENLTSNNPVGIGVNATNSFAEYATAFNVSYNPDLQQARDSLPVAITWDISGNDVYDSEYEFHSQGAARGGVGILLDERGGDSYSAKAAAQGFGFSGGVGVLADLNGSDSYTGDAAVQGSMDGGFLLDMGNHDDAYHAGEASQAGRLLPFPAQSGIGALVDQGGSDEYSAAEFSQGAGNVLLDLSGDDRYEATRTFPGEVFSQGAGLATAPGILLDRSGDDAYRSDHISQAVSSPGGGPGALVDFSGSDRFVAKAGQGLCRGGQALLYDEAGDDHYETRTGQGLSAAQCAGSLVDVSGHDVYNATGPAQGVGAGLLGSLVDAEGHDAYKAGSRSQGASLVSGGTGLLVDAFGSDAYDAGPASQGSGGDGGVGILVDGVEPKKKAKAKVQYGPNKVQVQATVLPDRGQKDSYTAGPFSQGSSGESGGVGLLVDNRDESDGRVTYEAGHHSQAAATGAGVGVLVNREGPDRYVAGGFSQAGSSGGHALLSEADGDDIYESTADTSQGFAKGSTAGTPPGAAVAGLVDANGSDQYSAPVSEDACTARGDAGAGLAVDTSGDSVPSGCPTAVLTSADALVTYAQQLVQDRVIPGFLTTESGTQPTSQTVYFYDDVEDATPVVDPDGWTTEDNSLLVPHPWRVVNQTLTPQPQGPNAHSGSQYWHVSAVGYPGVTYERFADSKLISPTIDLSGASNPELNVSIGGSSEEGFDQLLVEVWNLTDNTNSTVADPIDNGRTGLFGGQDLTPEYFHVDANLSEFAGHRIRVVFHFQSDILVQDGQGWNVDDVIVQEE